MDQIQKTYPRDVFLHLLTIITLYFSAFNFIRLIFEYVNVAFPDPLNPHYDPGGSMRWAIAALIVIFPVFLWGSRFLNNDIAKAPEKAELRIRKWLIYFTLFAAAALIIGDLVALVFNFLQGEFTLRFLLKVLTVLVTALAVFWYYFYDLRKKPDEFAPRAKIFVWAVSTVVGVAIIAGFFVAGSPFKQRLVRFDSQKVGDLQTIQWQIVNYWQQKERLPEKLDDLIDDISGFRPPLDPQTGATYEYQATEALAFELCAEFNLSSEESQIGGKERFAVPAVPFPVEGPFGAQAESWSHPAGRHCFERTIDPEIYRPQPKR